MKFFIYIAIFCFSLTKSYSQEQVKEHPYYLFSEFTKGIVLMKNGKVNKALLNYHTLGEQMIFKDNGKLLAIGPSQIPLIDTIFIEDRKFCTIDNIIVELIIHSTYDLYTKNKCKALKKGKEIAYGGTSELSANSSHEWIYAGGSVQNLNISDAEDYEFKPSITIG